MTRFLRYPPTAPVRGDSPTDAPPAAEPGEAARRRALLLMIENLEADRRKIEQARREWLQVVDVIADPIFVHDRDHRIIRANRAYAEAAGMDVKEVIGKRYWEVFPRGSGPMSCCARALQLKKAEEEEEEEEEEEVQTGSGKIYQSRAFGLRDAEDRYLYSMHILRDVTERKRAEREQLDTFNRLQKQFEAVGEATASHALWTADLPRYVRELTEIGARATGAERVNLWLFNHDETELCCLDLYEATPARHSSGMKLTEREFTNEFASFKSARYVDADDPLTDPRTAGYVESYLKPLRITSMLDAIVQHGGKHLGVLCFEHVDKPHHWKPDEIAFACQLADKFGLALVGLERLQAQKELSRSNRALKTLSACNEALVRATDEEKLLRDMCRVVVEVGGYRLAWVGWVEHDAAKSVRPVAHAGYDAGYLETTQLTWADTEHGRGPMGIAIRTGVPQAACDIHSDPRYAPWRAQALKHGYASGLALPLKGKDGEVFAVLNVYAAEPDAFDQKEIGLLQEMAGDLAFGLLTLRTRTERNLLQEENVKNGDRLKAALIGTIRAISRTVEKRDPYTAGHQQRVAELCVAIGRELGFDDNRLEGLRLGATIHDIGKIYVPAEILNRPGRLTKVEFEMIKSHPEVGYDIVKDVKFPWPVGEMILQHHERLDGTGYPKALKGEAITLEARILAVADTVEAMYSHRPYRPAHGLDAALAEIERHRGTRYDAAAVDACLRLFKEQGFALERP